MEANFLYKITDKFHITGRGNVVLGNIQSGSISVGDKVLVIKINEKAKLFIDEYEMTIKKMEGFRKDNITFAQMGDAVAIYLEGIEQFKLAKGIYIAAGQGIIELKNRLINI